MTTAIVLANAGASVTLLERDAQPPTSSADEAWDDWDRRGVPQFRQPHALARRFLGVLAAEAPSVADAVRSVGTSFNVARMAPSPDELADAERSQEVTMVRRPTLERLLATEAEEHPGIDVRRGVTATGLAVGAPLDGRLNVTGVRVGADTIWADLVVDCAGRRTPVGEWLGELGSPVDAMAESDGFSYTTRWFRLRGDAPELKAGAFGGMAPGLVALLFPSDGGIVGAPMVGSARDPVFRRVRDVENYTKVVAALPMVDEWTNPDVAEPITDMMPMASIQNRMLRLRRDDTDAPVGIINTGDSFASTNPSLGRGLSIAADLAIRLRELLADDPDPVSLVDRWDDIQQVWRRPWLDDSVHADDNNRAMFDSIIDERPTLPPHQWRADLMRAASVDMECWRAFNEVNQVLAPPTRWHGDADLLERAAAAAAEVSPPPPAMTRAELEQLVA